MAKTEDKREVKEIKPMIKRRNLAIGTDFSILNKDTGESVTDTSDFRPDIASIREKAIALSNTVNGLYDSDTELDDETLLSLCYARGMSRDITEIEGAKKYLETKIENAKEEDKKALEAAKNSAEILETFKKIEENTKNNKELLENSKS